MSGLKRKRGAGGAVLDAAKRGGDPNRSQLIDEIHAHTPNIKRIANMHIHMSGERSSSEHMLKSGQEGFHNRRGVNNNVHLLTAKFNRKPKNHFKSHMATYFPA